MLFMATKYTSLNKMSGSDSFRTGLLANANRGGENVATGALLGALFGAIVGYDGIPKELLNGLAKSERANIDIDFDNFLIASSFVVKGDVQQEGVGVGENESDL